MKSFLFSLLCLFISLSLAANTWIGGAGDWNDPANWSTGSVPNSSTSVILQNGKVFIPANYTATAATLTVESSALLTVEGTLAFQNQVNLNAIENYGKIYNKGLIRIDDYDATSANKGFGVVNHNYFWTGQNATFIAHELKRSGVKNTLNGYIFNMGDFEVTITGEEGILNQGNMVNYYGGELVIEGAGEVGLYCHGSSSSFSNYGDIAILDSADEGLFCASGTFTNRASGDITIEETGSEGIQNEFCTFDNDGDIAIEFTGGSGIYNNGQFDQQGTLFISHTDGPGIFNDEDFTNTNNITIQYSDLRGFRNESGNFDNFGYLSIRNVVSGAGLAIFQGPVTNHTGGHLHIQDINFVGIQITNFGNGQLTNNGTINIARTTHEGILSGNQLDNNGNITIDVSTTDHGFVVTSGGVATNSGSITINEADQIGLLVNDGQFHNENTGEIRITDAGFSGLQVQAAGSFINENSRITISLPTGVEHIRNLGSIENINCATISVDGKITNFPSGYFLNEAWVQTYYTGNNTNSGTFINKSGIGDQFGAFSSITIQNNSVLARPLTGTVQANVSYPNALDVGSFNYIKVQGIFTDENTTISAGKYYASNTFIPNNNAIGLNTLYVEMLDLQEECTYVFPIDIPGGVAPLVAPHQNGVDIAENGEEPTFSVFPNPSNGDIQIKGGTIPAGDYNIRLLDAQGKIQYQTEATLTAYEVQRLRLPVHLPRGLYLLQLGNNQEVVSNHRLLLQ